MRVLLKPDFSSDEAIAKMKSEGILPSGIAVRTDPETGRRYLNYVYRLSTDVDWEKIHNYVEATSNLIKTYCDFYPEGIYIFHGYGSFKEPTEIKVIVTLKRNESSGVTWEEIEIYAHPGISPKEMNEVRYFFVANQGKMTSGLEFKKWSSGIPYSNAKE